MKPHATYRLQLTAGFTFADAAAALPYLAELGISHVYLSPVLQAAPGSTHGYDVVDPDHVSVELGGEIGFASFVEAARAAKLGILLDIVPNHMSIAGTANRWWEDVLENGPASYYAPYFDVDWGIEMDDRITLPVLGERYGRALTSGTLRLAWENDRFYVYAHDMALPLSPRSLGPVVRRAGDRAGDMELQFVGDALTSLPSSRDSDPAQRERRHRDKTVLLARVDALCKQEPRCQQALAAEIAAINSDAVELDTLLERQNFRLAHWTVATSHFSYRRFFDITTLVGIRNEDPDVLLASHGRIFRWLRDGTIDGVRVDHVDGLREPAAYLQTLRAVASDAWIVVEKILAPEEQLPAWPVDGTTGYEFADRMSALLVDPDSERALTHTFSEYTGEAFDPASESRRARLEIMSDALHSELARLTELACRAAMASPACRDYTRDEVAVALAEIFAGYPTYRTYLGEGRHDSDRGRIARAVAAAKQARRELDVDLLDFLESALAFELTSPEALELARTAQQMTGPIVAKGDEDTLTYRQVRLLARCEVGTDLATYSAAPEEIHRQLAAGKPRSLLATSTHDTKRSEDVRARIAAISEIPERWGEAVVRWRERSRPGWGDVAPDRAFEYATWQTLVGAWPLPLERAQQWAEKATREARQRTSWRRPDTAYEAARTAWLERVYADQWLVGDIARIAALVQPLGDRNSLAQLLVKLTAPGVPDLYQGTELRDDSLVDPDNRRAVDLARRHARLRELVAPTDDILDQQKLWTIRRVLELRRAEPTRFDGTYTPLAATGQHAHRVFAFVRKSGSSTSITAVPRLTGAADGWRETALVIPPGRWRHVLANEILDGGKVPLAELWRRFPTALLVDV